ncbi:Transcription factor [Aspergillus sclerotialis]|uniref:Transcription factor n=1 Tax=Aspergillus sclerotialis TaxID=2070753 RepID=A0A3A3A5X1_9EURO|nr:Transcription factor [Aspergillus sclerotialis]
MPVCSRCQNTKSECRYVRSRRGLRPKPQTEDNQPDLVDDGLPLFSPMGDPFPDWLSSSALADLEVFTWADMVNISTNQSQTGQAMFPTLDTPQTLDLPNIPGDDALTFPVAQPEPPALDIAYDPMIQLYYQGFHRSHPFIVPRKALNTTLSSRVPQSTLSIMRYIGAHYYPDPTFKEIFRNPAYAGLSDGTVFNGFRVQNMLLLSIVEHAQGNEDSAHQTIQAAITLALEIGMNRASFARDNAWGSPIIEESWRRTYWELYVINGTLAAMRDQNSFVLHTQEAEVGLPCEESIYNNINMIPTPTTSMEDLKSYWSHNVGQEFSSFGYRIEAARMLGSVLALNNSLDINEDALVETTEASLVASLLHFPVSQQQSFPSSDYDDLIFQAQMILYLGLIHLHHPRSNMRFASFHAQTSCTRLRALESNSHAVELDLHSHKLLRSANMLSNLATLPGQVKHRTPFFTCALAMAVIVHVAGCLIVIGSDKEEPIRARIQLGLGALNALGKVWPLAAVVRRQLVDMYHEVGLGCK